MDGLPFKSFLVSRKLPMRADQQSMTDEIKQAISLLRRHL
jgi:hypothetical protein